MYLRDENGGTPLHYAASIGYLKGVCQLLPRSAYLSLEWDRKGYLPIHLACKMGHVMVVEEFLKQEWPNVKDMVTSQGQNILHVAAENRQEKLVKNLLDKGIVQCMINEKDKNGNTFMHLASKKFHADTLKSLSEDDKVDLKIKNNDDVTTFELIKTPEVRMVSKLYI